MSFVVELEDGHSITFSDGTSEAEVAAAVDRYTAQRDKAGNDASFGGFLKQAGAGYIAGLRDFGEGALDMVGILPESTAAARRTRDRAITDRPGGRAGRLAGNVAPSVLLGAGVGSGVGRLASAGRLGQAAANSPRLVQWGAGIADGALSGAALADPGNRGSGAATGATFSAAAGALTPMLSRTMRGLAQKSDDAQAMEMFAAQNLDEGEELFLPLHQAAGEKTALSRALKWMYGESLPFVPLVGGRLNKQADEAADAFRLMAAREAAGAPLTAGAPRPIAVGAGTGDDMLAEVERNAGQLQARNVGGDVFTPDLGLASRRMTSVDELASRIQARGSLKTHARAAANFVLNQLKQSVGPGGNVAGDDLMRARQALIAERDAARVAGSTPGSVANIPKAQALQNALDEFDDIVRGQFPAGRRGVAGKADFDTLGHAQEGTQVLRRAVAAKAADRGAFTGADLVRAAGDSPLNTRFRHLGQTQHALDQQAGAVPTVAGKWIAAGASGAAFLANPVATMTALTGAGLMTTKGVQRALMGDTAMQQRLLAAAGKDRQVSAAFAKIFGSEEARINALRMFNEAMVSGQSAAVSRQVGQE